MSEKGSLRVLNLFQNFFLDLISYLVYSNISKIDSHIYSSLGIKENNKFGILKAVGGKNI